MKLNKNVKKDKSYLLTIRYFQAQITRIPKFIFDDSYTKKKKKKEKQR